MSNEIITKEISTNDMLEISKLKPNRVIDKIKTSETIEKLLYIIKLKISSALKQNEKNQNTNKLELLNENAFDIENFEKMVIDIFSRSKMLDYLFTDLNKLIIGVFKNKLPLFLNDNYKKCLGANNLQELKDDIISGAVYEKCYAIGEDIKAKEYVSKLQNGESYEGVTLKTKEGKVIIWNSYGNESSGLEIRIGEENTYGRMNKNKNSKNKIVDKNLNLNTSNLINSFVLEVSKIIKLNYDEVRFLYTFAFLSSIIDTVWEKGQYLMNTITEDNNGKKDFIYNLNYGKEIQESDDIYSTNYSPENQEYINSSFKNGENDGYYDDEFLLNGKLYTWSRMFFKSKLLGVKGSFGIGTDAKSKDIAELEKSL